MEYIKVNHNNLKDNNISFQTFNHKYKRFNCYKGITFNKPSLTLHFSNLEQEMSEEFLLKYVQ